MQKAGFDYLNSRLMFGMVPGLSSTRKLCDALGNPEKNFKSIHVVGTNGKGSTSFYLAGILQAHNLRTGLYTSPHLVNLRERIRVNDEPIGEADLDRLLLRVKAAAENVSAAQKLKGEAAIEPTFFEVLTLVAFLYYAEQKVDVAVLEAGMGGRLDSTAVASGNLAIVTSIGLEHTEVLGPTESAILKEKMGVVGETRDATRGKTFVLGGLSPQLLREARERAAAWDAAVVVPALRNGVKLPNLGQHYIENATLSLKASEIFLNGCANAKTANAGITVVSPAYDDNLALRALKTRSWAGRMQKLLDANGEEWAILDGAHNSHAVRRLVETLDEYYPNQKFHCVFGALKDKDVGEMLKLMAPHVSHWHITKTPYPRFRELSDLQAELEGLGLKVASSEDLSRGYLDRAMAAARESRVPLLITGSLYMIGESIQFLKNDFEALKFFRGLEATTNEHR